MHINLFLIPFVLIIGLIMGRMDNKKNRLIYIVLCSVVLIFVAAMRSPEWMETMYNIDTLNYKNIFEYSLSMSWEDFWESAYMRYMEHAEEMDIGFFAFNKTIGLITHDFHTYSVIADLIFFIPLGVLLYRYCTSISQIVFAFVFYIALIQIFLFGGARQIFAMGFDMVALIAILDKKRLWAMVFFLLGIFIHFSSILFFPPLIMVWMGVRPSILKFSHVLCFLVFPIVLTMPNEIIVFMGDLMGMEKYAEYGKVEIQGGATTFIILIEMLSLFCLLAIKVRDLLENENIRYFYIMAPFFTLFAPLIHSNGSMIRVSLYYHLFLMFLVPYAIECLFNVNNRRFAYVIAIGIMAILTLSNGGITYFFYWQI